MKANSLSSDKSRVAQYAAAQLAQKCELPFAFVIAGTTVIYTQGLVDASQGQTPAANLLKCFFEEHEDLSFFVLRSKIYVSYRPTAYCHGIAKVVAKGVQQIDPSGGEAPARLNYLDIDRRFLQKMVHRELQSQWFLPISQPLALSSLREAMSTQERSLLTVAKLHLQDRPVFAVLLDDEGRVIMAAQNSNRLNKTQHAEINCLNLALKSQHTGSSPRKWKTLVVSHKPCKMCAGLIWETCLKWENFKVYYFQEELGSQSRDTVLDLGTSERQRFASAKYLNKEFQHLVES